MCNKCDDLRARIKKGTRSIDDLLDAKTEERMADYVEKLRAELAMIEAEHRK